MCGPVTEGYSGGLCLGQDQCREGACIDVPEVGKRCAVSCIGPEDDCLQGYLSCQSLGGLHYCLVTPG